jgi:hypothetical protein
MYSGLLVVIAIGAFAVLAWGLREWQRRDRPVILLFNLLALGAVAMHVLLAGIGRFLGPGDTLRDLYALPMLVAAVALPASLFTFATLCRRIGFRWARIDWGHGAVCLFAFALLLYGLPDLRRMRLIEPSIWHDVVRYVRADRPIAPLVVLAAYAALGAGLWFRLRWPWLLAGMVAGLALLPLPGALPQLLGETLCFVAIVVATVRYLGAGQPAATVS